ncbi:hypothetical protein [Geofilum rubicundum]|uniref:DUF4382 domain-containing protein n=1 Tax=Geofilum rubicundum JCM 15548 TaxID=1236989 RepID=A0A0E9LRH4_9BACT|nr:hypothetical protein [Geofilum rubicundum]GAO27751.1 hypothetical protein JCM15548_14601 [Geofilum rubicundum JCM 15548]
MKKIKFKILVLAAILVASVTFTSCEKDESETATEPQIGLKFKTVTSSVSLKSTQARELSFTSGFITLREVQFEVETDNDSIEIEFELEINTKIDFATGETNPDISFAQIPAGTYNEMEVEIELQDEGDTPAMVLNGTYVDADGVSHDVRFEYNSGETFEVEKEGTIVFATNESALTQITFDPTVWFAKVENEQLSNATKDNDGIIVISETQNANIFDVVADGLDLVTEIEM